MAKQGSRFGEFKTYLREELIAHLPYTFVGLAAGLALVGLAMRMTWIRFGEEEFHTAHFIHIFFSAAAGSAIFHSYKDSLIKALPVVVTGSIALCSLSDSLIPFWSFHFFHKAAAFHVCALEHPLTVLCFAAAGFVLGGIGIRFFKHCNRPFHLAHILISTSASVLYLVSFTDRLTAGDFAAVTVSLFFSLAIPCLIGDVTLPLCFVTIREEYLHEKVHHRHT